MEIIALVAIGIMMNLNVLAADNKNEKQGGMPPVMQKKEVKVTIYKDVALIDGIGNDIQKNMSIIVSDDKISTVVPTSQLTDKQTAKAEIIDGSKWYALPGLVESHTHVATLPNRQYADFVLNRQLYGGITTARDLAGDARALADISRAALVQEIPSPDLKYVALMAGPRFFADPRTKSSGMGVTPGEVSWMQAVTKDTDMKTAVAYSRGTWASAIKTYANIDGRTMKLIGDEARKQGIPVWSHAQVGPADALEVAQARVHSMSHATGLFSAAFTPEIRAKEKSGELRGFIDIDKKSPKIDELFKEMKKHNIVLDATLRVYVEGDKRTEKMKAKMKAEGKDYEVELKKRNAHYDSVRPKTTTQDAYDITYRAYKSGIRISSGTDGWMGPKEVYPALYEEFDLLNKKAKMPMMDVIKAGTINGAYSIGLEKEIGSIEMGKYANIVFLTENPLKGAESFKSIELTVKRGTAYYRKDFTLGSPGEGFEGE